MYNHTSLEWIVLGYHHTETVGSELTRTVECELVEAEVRRAAHRIAIQMLYSIEILFKLGKCRNFLLCGVELDPVSQPYTSEELCNIGSGFCSRVRAGIAGRLTAGFASRLIGRLT